MKGTQDSTGFAASYESILISILKDFLRVAVAQLLNTIKHFKRETALHTIGI